MTQLDHQQLLALLHNASITADEADAAHNQLLHAFGELCGEVLTIKAQLADLRDSIAAQRKDLDAATVLLNDDHQRLDVLVKLARGQTLHPEDLLPAPPT